MLHRPDSQRLLTSLTVLLLLLLLAVPWTGCAHEAGPQPQAQPQPQAETEPEPEPEAEAETEPEADAEAEAPPQPGIWVLRHGEDGGTERALTERGRSQVRQAAQPFEHVEGLRIWTSPRTRCVQTARIVHEVAPDSRLEVVQWLDYADPLPSDWQGRLPEGPLLLVTHQPVVQRILRDLDRPVPDVHHAFITRLDEQP